MQNLEKSFEKPTRKRLKAIGITSLLSVIVLAGVGANYLIKSHSSIIDGNLPDWEKALLTKKNELALYLDDKLDFNKVIWQKEGFQSENMSNLGDIASNGKWTIHRDGDIIYRNRYGSSFNQSKQITKDFAYHINVTKDGIFYENVSDGNKLYSVDFYGKNKKVLSNDQVSYVQAYDGWIYYTDFSKHTHLYKMKPDGSKNQAVINAGVMGSIIKNGYIYYSNFEDNSAIYRANLKTKKQTKLTSDSAWRIFVTDKYIYYQNSPSYEGTLKRIPINGGSPETLVNDKVDGYIVANDKYVFYSIKDPVKSGFYKLNLVTKEKKKLYNESFHTINLYQNYIYMSPFNSNKIISFNINE